MAVHVNIKVKPHIAHKLRSRSMSNGELSEIFNIERDFGITIKPLHTNTEDPLLISHFVVEVPDQATAKTVATRFLQSKVVEAAYVKPPEAPA
jgi:hypothetical protein